MILRVGSRPSTKAGKQTEAQMDFRLRGGTVTIRRLVLPFNTSVSSWQIASICQFRDKRPPPETIGNEACTKEYKSDRKTAAASRISGGMESSSPITSPPVWALRDLRRHWQRRGRHQDHGLTRDRGIPQESPVGPHHLTNPEG